MNLTSELIYNDIKEMVCSESEHICILEDPLTLKTELGFTFTVTMVDYVNGVLRTDHGVMVEAYTYHSLIQLRDYIKEQQINDALMMDSYLEDRDEVYDRPEADLESFIEQEKDHE